MINNISDTNQGAIVIDTKAGIERYRLLAIRSALRIEVETGMKMSRGAKPADAARQELIAHGKSAPKNKEALLTIYTQHLYDIGMLVATQAK